MNPLEEARAALQVLLAEVEEFASREGTLDEDADARFELLVTTEVPAAQARVAQLEERAHKIEALREASKNINTLEAGADPGVRSKSVKKDPFDFSTLPMVAPGTTPSSEFRSRAHDAIEQAPEYVADEEREQIARLVDRDQDGNVAGHCLRYGGPEYTESFMNYIRGGQFRMNDGSEMRAALSTTSANGGYLIPFHLDPTIILTNAGSTNPFRQISRVETLANSNIWHGVSSAGVTAEWIGEATEVADASPTFAQPTITPYKADAYIQASFEVTQDSNIASQVGMMFADAKDNLEATAHATGSGSSQPWGIVTRLAATTASRVAANTNAAFGLVDVYALVNALPARHQNNATWVAHWATFNSVRRFGEGSVGAGAFWADLGPGIPPQLLGKSAYTSSVMHTTLSSATASTDNLLILGDFSKYCIVDRVGAEIVYNPLVVGSSFRPTGQVGWAMFWRTGADVTDAGAFRLLQV